MSLSVWVQTPVGVDRAREMGAAIVAKIDAHPGWELVQDWTSTSYRYWVVKCLKESSGLPADYFVIFRAAVGNSDLTWLIAEEYDGTAHATRRMALSSRYDMYSMTLAADGTATGDTWVPLDTANITNNGRSVSLLWVGAVDYISSDVEIVVSVGAKFLAIYKRGDAGPKWIGAFDSQVVNPAVNDPMPLASYQSLASMDNSYGYLASTIRHPFKGGQTFHNPNMLNQTGSVQFGSWAQQEYPGSSYGSGDLFQGGKTPLWQIALTMYVNGQYASYATQGFMRGTFPGVRYCLMGASAGGYLDAMTADGETWVYTGGFFWLSTSA